MAEPAHEMGLLDAAVKWIFGLIALAFAGVIAFFSVSFRTLTKDVGEHGQKIAALEENNRNMCDRVDELGERMDQSFQRIHERLDNFTNRTH